MKYLTGRMIILALIVVLISTLGCVRTKTIWISEPDSAMSSNEYFQAKLEPIKQGNDFYTAFQVEVKNLTQNNLSIDWNKTLYIHNGHRKGIFVFKGINPEDIRNLTIPYDSIPAGEKYSKIIVPFKLLARAPIMARTDDTGISAGILPNGQSSILLVVRQKGKEVAAKMTVVIKERTEQ